MSTIVHPKRDLKEVKLHVITTSSSQNWRNSDVYKKAIEATGSDFRLKRSAFQERADTWEPNARSGFLHAVQSLAQKHKRYQALFNDEVLDVVPRMNEAWMADTASLYFQVAAQYPEAEKMVIRYDVFERLNYMGDPVRKMLLGAILIHPIPGLKEKLLSEELLDELVSLSKTKSKTEVALYLHEFMQDQIKRAKTAD